MDESVHCLIKAVNASVVLVEVIVIAFPYTFLTLQRSLLASYLPIQSHIYRPAAM